MQVSLSWLTVESCDISQGNKTQAHTQKPPTRIIQKSNCVTKKTTIHDRNSCESSLKESNCWTVFRPEFVSQWVVVLCCMKRARCFKVHYLNYLLTHLSRIWFWANLLKEKNNPADEYLLTIVLHLKSDLNVYSHFSRLMALLYLWVPSYCSL